jgi:hypothetical protein
VDVLFVADDGSTDNSWDIIKSFKGQIEYMQREPNPKDKGQKQALLAEIQRRYRPEDTWVQVIESDIMIAPFVEDLRFVIKDHAINDVAVYWRTWNAVSADWITEDTYPNWNKSITEVMPRAHLMENMLYTFRPIPGTAYTSDQWRPWPQGLAKHLIGVPKQEKFKLNSPILIHYGHRGPTHFWLKYRNLGTHHPKYRDWDLTSPETVLKTVAFFNGAWGNLAFEPTREGWRNRRSV